MTVKSMARAGEPPAEVSADWTPGLMRFELSPEVGRYVLAHSHGPCAAGRALMQATAALGEPAVMMIAPEQYGFLRLLASMLGARRALDLGTFTGLSAMALAEGVGEGGCVVTVDRNPAWIDMARTYWRDAGVEGRVQARTGEIAEVLASLPLDEPFDLVFIDADKAQAHHYVEQALLRLSPHGIVVLDNVLWHGWVMEADRVDDDTQGMRHCNARLAGDPALEVTMLPIADGISIVRRRPGTGAAARKDSASNQISST